MKAGEGQQGRPPKGHNSPQSVEMAGFSEQTITDSQRTVMKVAVWENLAVYCCRERRYARDASAKEQNQTHGRDAHIVVVCPRVGSLHDASEGICRHRPFRMMIYEA